MIKHIKEDKLEEELEKYDGIVLVDFYAKWCGPCLKLSPILEEIANSRAGYNILKVDINENPKTIARLNIDTIPTICLYKDGSIIEKKIGFRSKQEIIHMFERNY